MMVIEDVSGSIGSMAPQSQYETAPFIVAPVTKAAIIVAHPDDETLWTGGMMLLHPEYQWFVTTLCRKNDPDRSVKFFQVLNAYGASGTMADLDDGPEQTPLAGHDVELGVLGELPPVEYELVITHAPSGEYTRHRRHEEVSHAVIALWKTARLLARELWLFAYEDDQGRRLPRAVETAHHFEALPESIWQEKYRLITEVYGFSPDSWEARTTPRNESFWRFQTLAALQNWLEKQ